MNETRVTPERRLHELWPEIDLGKVESLTYEWSGHGNGAGYERLDLSYPGGGGYHYQGVYHPGDGCCEGNPCRYCGRTVWD